jgi:hypothetical protein
LIRNFGEEATIYAGDMKREDSILEWLLVQKDPSNEAIEEVEGDDLRSVIKEADAVAVFVCKLILIVRILKSQM